MMIRFLVNKLLNVSFIVVFLFSFFTSCVDKKSITPIDIKKKYRNTIAKVEMSYYFESSFKFKGLDKSYVLSYSIDDYGNIILKNTEEDIENYNITYVSGFLLSEGNYVITNKTLFEPKNERLQLLKTLKNLQLSLKSKMVERIKEIEKIKREQQYIIDTYIQNELPLDWDYRRTVDNINSLNEEIKEFRKGLKSFEIIGVDDLIIKLKINSLGVHLSDVVNGKNNLYVNCDIARLSNDENVDLAILKLDSDYRLSEKFKSNINYFSINPKINPLNNVKSHDTVYRLGYNFFQSAGARYAPTLSKGVAIKVKDALGIIYTDVSTDPSKGSPVVDKYGNLIAVDCGFVEGINQCVTVNNLSAFYSNF